MGTVEWSELLRWIPRDPRANPDPETPPTDRRDGPAVTAPAEGVAPPKPVRRAEPGKLTLAAL